MAIESLSKTKHTEDADLVLSLLGEYAPKLRAMCEEYASIRSIRARRKMAIFFTPGLLVVGSVYVAFFSSAKSGMSQLFSPIELIVAISMIAFGFVFAAFYVEVFKQPRGRRLQWLEGDLKLLAAKVEKLIRTASQLNENLSLELGRRLQFEFRILEAEASMKYCESVLVTDSLVSEDKNAPDTPSKAQRTSDGSSQASKFARQPRRVIGDIGTLPEAREL